MKKYIAILAAVLTLAGCNSLKDGDYTLTVMTTGDVHGRWFDSDYVSGATNSSLFSINHYADSIRTAVGEENFILIDAGDCLQGDNASYYFNYVDTLSPHLYPRLAKYMEYDVITVGNHDVETGHGVYDRVRDELESYGIPFLGGNAIRTDNGEPYFKLYTILRKNGLKVAIIGFTNANMKAWLNESIWSGMDFLSLVPYVQEQVDKVIAKEKPDVVIVSTHSGTGNGDGSMLESQGLDLYNSLKNVDLLLGSHDHRPYSVSNGSLSYVDVGNNARNFGLCEINVKVEGGKVVSKSSGSKVCPADITEIDLAMKEYFKEDFEAVKAFTMRKVGELKTDLSMAESFVGMCDYMNMLHTVCLGCEPAEISIAAPLSMDSRIKAGTLIYNDMFSLYRYENMLFVVRMSGQEIKDFLEYSYDMWIQTATSPSDHVLRIAPRPDPRYGTERWSFERASYNFDSAAGINYTVDVTKNYGDRIAISTMADGTPFDLGKTYNVAMTSYRASGGGETMVKGAGIDTANIDERVVNKYPAIRDLIYDFIAEKGEIGSEQMYDPAINGSWKFIPENIAGPALKKDFSLMFGERR